MTQASPDVDIDLSGARIRMLGQMQFVVHGFSSRRVREPAA